MKLIYTYFLLLLSLIIFSQDRKQINGKVYILDKYHEMISGIYVKNISINYTTLTDITGNFIIPAQIGDQITFQSFNIEKRTILVTQKMFDQLQMKIQLDLKEKQLEDISVTPFKTFGSIELDVRRIPMMNKTNEILKKLGNLNPSQKMDGSTDVNTELAKLSSMKFGIEGILDFISGDGKRKERLSIFEEQSNIIKKVREYFGDTYFEELGLKKNEINDFILYAYLNHNLKFYYDHNNYFQILNIFDKNIYLYKARKNTEKTITPKVGKIYFPD
ncbi:CarboxypepD_reg-like domain-containing protein [Apibacter mensalis]|uniref:CarboxypepD_reg-like domain-containing protein n=1 Tax=Apibacter mensalis TaxID=1586267 RepID=A0A0X3AQQ1_9FLAO|nr:hypothetical protein [Apibacter mensalis]CVK16711.1 CarboxypepD_reg-like domain-containing protein [Apibacter mensalis]